jgi:hypothetical protein
VGAPAAAALVLLVSLPRIGGAQAWVPLRGQGAVSFSFQRIDNAGHRLSDGFLAPGGSSVNMSGYIELDYALTDRLSFTAGLPYVFGKYTDTQAPPPPLPFLPRDQCRCWHSGWQDFGITGRYNLFRTNDGSFSITPSVATGLPSHDYDYRGESTLGSNLKEITVALDVGSRLDAVSPNLSVAGRYSYGFVERVLDIPHNRSNIAAEGRYAFSRGKLLARGFAIWQRTHGGLRTGTPDSFPGELNTEERIREHDRLLRDNYFRAGAGVSYSFPRVDIFASVIWYVSGTDTHAGSAVTVGMSWPFEWSALR